MLKTLNPIILVSLKKLKIVPGRQFAVQLPSFLSRVFRFFDATYKPDITVSQHYVIFILTILKLTFTVYLGILHADRREKTWKDGFICELT